VNPSAWGTLPQVTPCFHLTWVDLTPRLTTPNPYPSPWGGASESPASIFPLRLEARWVRGSRLE